MPQLNINDLQNLRRSKTRKIREKSGFLTVRKKLGVESGAIELRLDARRRDSTGVRRRLERDGFSREAWWWFASVAFHGRQQPRRWSVDKYGDRGAWQLAKAQRQEWEKMMGV